MLRCCGTLRLWRLRLRKPGRMAEQQKKAAAKKPAANKKPAAGKAAAAGRKPAGNRAPAKGKAAAGTIDDMKGPGLFDDDSFVKMPTWLPKQHASYPHIDGREIWKATVEALKKLPALGIEPLLDVNVIEQYVMARYRYLVCSEFVAVFGHSYENAVGNRARHPESTVQKESSQEMERLGTRLGLNPRARQIMKLRHAGALADFDRDDDDVNDPRPPMRTPGRRM